MRAFTGWRFILAVAMPLVLASLGAINLSYDLLNRVSSAGNDAEHLRNRKVLEEAMQAATSQLASLTLQNARWNEAALATKDTVDPKWFAETWGAFDGLRQGYDMVAVLDMSGEIIAGKTKALPPGAVDAADTEGMPLPELAPKDWKGREVVSGFAKTPFGPAIVAFAPIVEPQAGNRPNGRILFMGHRLSKDELAVLGKQLLVGGLHIAKAEAASDNAIMLPAIAGTPTLGLSWEDRNFGSMVTNAAWAKASAVLAFLILVMTGIGVVCWRLVQNLVKNEEEAKLKALTDHLTGLPNRNALQQRMADIRASTGEPYALAFADLDGFKEVNDSYGHHIGDRLICMVAAGISSLAKGASLSARLGGDEFVVMFVGEECLRKAEVFATQLIRLLAQPFDMEGRLASVGASIGIAGSAGGVEESEVLRRADVAMYKAKSEGKNRFWVFDKTLDHEREENLAITNELREHIKAKALDVVFQPVVNAKTLLISGVEALVRWPQSAARSIGPEKFCAIAETSGQIDELGELVVNKACEAAKAWPDLRLAVNISALQLNNPRFVRNMLDILDRHGVSPRRLEFEITETSIIHGMERAKEVFKELKLAGAKIALDDFGSGFSSIGYLRTFQFDRIKIDRSIVSKVMSSPSEFAILQGALLVARGLSADVTAEGVEHAEEVPILRLAGVTELQGFYFHKPMQAADVSKLVDKHKALGNIETRVVA